MDFGLLAGGASRGITDALTGANAGLMQGEQVRAGRAQEDLARQHLGMQGQQLTNALAQQAWQRGLQQQQLGLHQQQLESQDAWRRAQMDWHNRQIETQDRYHQGMLDKYGAELGMKQQELPYKLDVEKERANWFRERNRGGGAGGGGTALERFKNGTAIRMGYDTYLDAPPEVQVQIDRQFESQLPFGGERRQQFSDKTRHYADMHANTQRILQEAAANPRMTTADKITMHMVEMDQRKIGQALAMQQQAQRDGIPFRFRDPQSGEVWTDETLAQRINANYQKLEQMRQGYLPAGAQQAPPQMSLQDAFKALGLTAPGAKK